LRGGKRKGVGRKPIPEEKRKKMFTVRIDQDILTFLKTIKNKSKLVNDLLRKEME